MQERVSLTVSTKACWDYFCDCLEPMYQFVDERQLTNIEASQPCIPSLFINILLMSMQRSCTTFVKFILNA